jgi:hypothetical protein
MGRYRTLAAALCALFATSNANAADTTIFGCNEGKPGEIGVRELVADVGDTVRVAVTIHTTNPVDAFSLDVAFPTDLLAYVSIERGELTSGFSWLDGTYRAADGAVRVSGFDLDAIASGAYGRLAWISFEVLAPGDGEFSSSNYIDDIRSALGYVSCESAHTPTSVEESSWGRLKAAYGAPSPAGDPER